MKKIQFQIAFFVLITLPFSSQSQNYDLDTMKVQDFEFKGWFGYMTADSAESVISLLGTGFFRTPRSENIDSLISTWIESHPTASILPIYTFGPLLTNKPDSKMTYALLIDEADTLNIYLVRHGGIPGGTMQRPKTWKEMSRKERKLYNDRPEEKVHMGDRDYENYIEIVKTADEFARENNLGVYAEND